MNPHNRNLKDSHLNVWILRFKETGKICFSTKTPYLINFYKNKIKTCIETVESGIMTKDLAGCVHGTFSGLEIGKDFYTTDDFMQAIDERLQHNMSK